MGLFSGPGDFFSKDNPNLTWVSGSQAKKDAEMGIRSDKNGKKRFKPDKPGKSKAPTLSGSDKRKLEKIANKRERGERLTSSDKSFLRSHGFKA
jgi:hypothetical protein